MVEPAGVGASLLRVTILFLVLTWVTVIARLSVRRWLRPEAKGLDDLMMCIGLILYTVTCCLVIVCCYYGAGQLSKYLTTDDIMQGTKIFFVAEFFYAGCTVPIKSSICICLLRVADGRRRFSWTLWGLVALQFMAAIIFFAGVSNICHPITTLWGETTYGTCDSKLNSSVSFLFSAVSILTDISLAILPAILIWPIQMKLRLKISVAIILGMAAFASCATIIRLRYLTLYDNQAEFMFSAGPIGLWSIVEEGISIVAGSMPALRPLLSLPMFGGTRDASKGASRPETDLQTWGAGDKRSRTDEFGGSVKMQTFVSGSSSNHPSSNNKVRVSKDGDSDGESQTHILKETRVTVSSEVMNSTGTEEWTKRRINGWDREANK